MNKFKLSTLVLWLILMITIVITFIYYIYNRASPFITFGIICCIISSGLAVEKIIDINLYKK